MNPIMIKAILKFCTIKQMFKFSFHENYIGQSSHYTALALQIRVSSFVSCPPPVVNETPRYLKFSICFSVALFTYKKNWSGFLERWSISVLTAFILFWRCHMLLQSYLIRKWGQILWKKAESNHQRIADDRFCDFRLWHTHQLGCICRFYSFKTTKRRGD